MRHGSSLCDEGQLLHFIFHNTAFPLISAPAFIISSSFYPRRLIETRRLLEARRLLFRCQVRPEFPENFALKWPELAILKANCNTLEYFSLNRSRKRYILQRNTRNCVQCRCIMLASHRFESSPISAPAFNGGPALIILNSL